MYSLGRGYLLEGLKVLGSFEGNLILGQSRSTSNLFYGQLQMRGTCLLPSAALKSGLRCEDA